MENVELKMALIVVITVGIFLKSAHCKPCSNYNLDGYNANFSSY
jgi:hypothetical protein